MLNKIIIFQSNLSEKKQYNITVGIKYSMRDLMCYVNYTA